MNRPSALAFSISSRRHRKGIALLLVLACLALLTLLVVAFLSSVGTELKTSKVYANGASVKLLSQTAVNIVQSEINDATRDGALCWASQPGMIRTYDNTGAPVKYYKLYSNNAMVVGTATTPSVTSFSPGSDYDANWKTKSALYTDLNAPVVIPSTGAALFPILDGNSVKSLVLSASGVTESPYLGYDADGDGKPDVDGFAVDSSVITSSVYNQANPPTVANNPVPMPVRWLYLLQDGTVTAPATVDATGKTASWTGPAGSAGVPGPDNPIVGRIAFWTDDDTCKLNINTAGSGIAGAFPATGSYWDVPRTVSEGRLALNSPVQGEFQRYPGHPATTWLNGILNNKFTAAEILAILPRYVEGGSVGGTVKTTQGVNPAALTLPTYRLFATDDEFLFSPTRGLNSATNMTNSVLERIKFFITASSRAPDVNLFNQPRICLWPITISSNPIKSTYQSLYDQVIAFCSTMGNNLSVPRLYYFQRQDSTDASIDLPTTNSDAGLNRNRRLLEYLRYLTGQSIPGFGGAFSTKYSTSNGNGGTDRDQILTEMFDYIRSTNLVEPGLTNPYTPNGAGGGQVVPIDDTTTGTHGFGRFYTVQGAALLFIANADGDEAGSQPSSNPVPAGKRRIQMAFLPQLFDPSEGTVFDRFNFQMSITGLTGLTAGGTQLFASDYPATTSSYATFNADGGGFGDQMGFRSVLSSAMISASVDVAKAPGTFSFSASGPITITLKTLAGKTVQTVSLSFPTGTISLPIPTMAPSGLYNYKYGGGLAAGDTSPYNLRYFGTPPDLATPNVVSSTVYGTSGLEFSMINQPSAGGRLSAKKQSDAYTWLLKCDVVRSVAIAGDPRLIAAQKTPATSGAGYLFAPIGDWSSSTLISGMHSLVDGIGSPFYGAVNGQLVKGASYDGNGNVGTLAYSATTISGGGTPIAQKPGGFAVHGQSFSNYSDVFDPTTGGALNGVKLGSNAPIGTTGIPGDWDNGVNIQRDGAFINKADEGDQGAANPPYDWKGASGNIGLSSGLFTPNRMMPSAGMFGSLPTGVNGNKHWQTLLFRPGPQSHPGLGVSTFTVSGIAGDYGAPYTTPPDHLFLDLFNMPVVEPYAISEPLSTAGRINMNYQIAPFTYLTRDAGIRAVLAWENVITIANSQAGTYKQKAASTTSVRTPVNIDATLYGFKQRFGTTPATTLSNGLKSDLFRSAAEICHLDIVPTNATGTNATAPTRSSMDSFWSSYLLTGDNSRERIYTTVYPRLTTKSNTFTVHFRVQTLKKVQTPGYNSSNWVEDTDLITGEFRGSETIERYVDPNDPQLPDFAANPSTTQTLSPYYKFRVVSVKEFAP